MQWYSSTRTYHTNAIITNSVTPSLTGSGFHIDLNFSSHYQFFYCWMSYSIRVATLNLPISNRRSAFISISVRHVNENKISQDTSDSERASSMNGEVIDQEYNNKRDTEFKMKLVTSFSSCTMINKQLCLLKVCSWLKILDIIENLF